MKIWGITLFIASLLNLCLGFFVATDKIKLGKSTQILYFLMVSMNLFIGGLKAFSGYYR
jgi:hypothetical protein